MARIELPDRLAVRWLGRVAYRDALWIQQSFFNRSDCQYLLLLEHQHVFTYGSNADLATNLKCDPKEVGAELIKVNRGGDVSYHGPGQLVGYPIISLPPKHGVGGPSDTRQYIWTIEQLIIDALQHFGVKNASRFCGYPGVWICNENVEPKKVCAIGVRVSRGRTMHGFALNVDPDLRYMREHIVPCGISEYGVTSLAELGLSISMREVVDTVAELAAKNWTNGNQDRQDVSWSNSNTSYKIQDTVEFRSRKPPWLRAPINHDLSVLETSRKLRDLNLVTVCEEAGCPNQSECWSEGTATIMVLGDRCTRACGFCLIDSRKPVEPDADEPFRVAQAVKKMKLEHAVLTMVARDDLADGGMTHVAKCVQEIRRVCLGTQVETLISDVKGSDALKTLFDAVPDVLNHNIETVARLQRQVRPSASYGRSLAVLARASASGLTTKSGLMLGLGESQHEVEAALYDLRNVGVQIVTIGQYLRPSQHHLPVIRWAEPAEFEHYARFGEQLGIGHVQSSPLTRSSYHAKKSARLLGSQMVSVRQ